MDELKETISRLLHNGTHHDGTLGGFLLWAILLQPRAIAIGALIPIYVVLSVLKALADVMRPRHS